MGFQVVLYGAPNQVLGFASTSATIVYGADNEIAIVIGANIVSAAMQSSATTVHVGQPQTLTLSATTKDAAGIVITGGDPYALPVTLSLSGNGAAAFQLQSASLTSPQSTSALAYNGGGTAGQTVAVQPGIAQPFAPALTPVTITIAP